MKPGWVDYDAFIASAQWKAIRKSALRAAKYRCNECGLRQRKGLHVHHLTYKRFGGREFPNDLLVLCSPCHDAHHFKGKKLKPRAGKPEPAPLKVVKWKTFPQRPRGKSKKQRLIDENVRLRKQQTAYRVPRSLAPPP